MIIEKHNIKKLLEGKRVFDFFSSHYAKSGKSETGHLMDKGLYTLPFIENGEVIWGYHIIEEALRAGLDEIFCGSTGNTPLSTKQKLEAALLSESRRDKYTWDEKERLYLFIASELKGETDEYLLGLVQQGGSFIPSAALYLSLPGYMKELVAKELVDLKTAKSCSGIAEEAFRVLEKHLLIQTFSKRRIMLVNFAELIKRDSLEVDGAKVLAERITAEDDPYAAIERLRYPDLAAGNEEFSLFCNENLGNTGIRLKNPPYFEGDSYSVEFSFRSVKQLERIIASLGKLKEKADEIFRLL